MKINVSVILPFYNGTKTLKKTLESLLNQTYEYFEIIIVNDGSPEPLNLALGEYYGHKKIRVIEQVNQGIASARNTGIKEAHGEFIAFCDQDDIWYKSKLEKQVPKFENENVGLVYSWNNTIDIHGNSGMYSPRFTGRCFYDLAIKNFITCCTVVVRKSLLQEIGYFNVDKKLQGVDDRYVWMKIARLCEIAYVPEALACYVFHGGNYSLNERKMLVADEYCLLNIGRLADLSSSERKSCEIGLINVYHHYAGNFLYNSQYLDVAQCYRKLWALTKWRLDFLFLWLIFTSIPSSFFNALKSLKQALVKFKRTSS